MSEAPDATPRITMTVQDGSFDLYLNEAGRDLLVRELLRLDETRDHVHLAPEDMGEIALAPHPYEGGQDVLQWGKILLRPDAWDREHFPHVIPD